MYNVHAVIKKRLGMSKKFVSAGIYG